MRKYLINLTLFSLIVALMLAFPIVCLIKAGEIYPYSHYTHPLQEKQLFGLAYSYYDQPYKLSMSNYYKPDVLALGSSRMLTFREDIVKEGLSFYNAGGSIQNIYELSLFVRQCTFVPKLILVNFDQWWFNPNYKHQKQEFSEQTFEVPAWRVSKILNCCRDFYYDFVEGKVILDSLRHSTHIGLNAICKHDGFAKDGTRNTDNLFYDPAYIQEHFEETFSRIREGNRRFEYGAHADPSVAEAVELFLEACERKGITVVAFIPTFAPSICRKMHDLGQYSYIHEIAGILATCFNRYRNCYLYDYTDMKEFGIRDYDFTDGFHGSVLVSNTILQDILMQNQTIRKYFITDEALDSINTVYRRQLHVDNPRLRQLKIE